MKPNWAYELWYWPAQWLLGGISLALLTLICFRFQVNSTTVALLYLIVIVVVSLKSSLIPSALFSLIAYISLDYFFTAPLFTLGLNQTLDFVAPVAYLSTSFVITSLMSKVRRSIEEQRQSEATLREARAELALVSRVVTMGELAASIAHEINQPLTAIVNNGSACLRWLATDPPDLVEAKEAAKDIIRDGNRASEIIGRTRALLRKSPTEKTALDINKTIQEVMSLISNEAAANGVEVQLRLASDLPSVLGDRVQIQQVILNLVLNGVEAMSSVSSSQRVLLVSSSRHGSGEVLIAVKDTGLGIDPQQLEKIFDAFFTTKSQGLGMGLAISRSIVEDHGGILSVLPNDGPGTTFQFTLLKYK